jgi:hypothetical protein
MNQWISDSNSELVCREEGGVIALTLMVVAMVNKLHLICLIIIIIVTFFIWLVGHLLALKTQNCKLLCTIKSKKCFRPGFET